MGLDPNIEEGVFVGPGYEDGLQHPKPPGYWHWWVRLPDGTIVDGATTQFSLRDLHITPPLVILPLDPRQRWYLPSTGEENSAGYFLVRHSQWENSE